MIHRFSNHRCVFCDRKIAREYVVCQDHLEWYLTYKDTSWFKSIKKMHQRQETIDSRESGMFYDSGVVETGTKVKENTTRIDKIHKLLMDNISYKEIAERMQVSVKYVHAVRSYLKKMKRL